MRQLKLENQSYRLFFIELAKDCGWKLQGEINTDSMYLTFYTDIRYFYTDHRIRDGHEIVHTLRQYNELELWIKSNAPRVVVSPSKVQGVVTYNKDEFYRKYPHTLEEATDEELIFFI